MADPFSDQPNDTDDTAAAEPAPAGKKGKAKEAKPFEPTQEQKLRELAGYAFTTFRAPDGRMYGVEKHNPRRALRHGKPSELMRAVALRYVGTYNAWPGKDARAAVADFLEAVTEEHRHVPVRCHWDRKRLLLHIADDADTVICIDGNGIRPIDQPGIAFRRAATAAPMPWPLPSSGDLDLLWKLVRVVDADRPIVLALLIMAWLTGLPQPVVLVTGPFDAGKTTTARFLLSLVDPVTHQRGGSLPEREDEWKARVAQGRVVFVDNSGHITTKVSDLMCRVATGGELTTRLLFTNDDAHVSDLLVPVWLTSIDSGVLRGDLQSRIVPVELEGIDQKDRAVHSDLESAQDDARPAITRALLDLADKVVAMLPRIDRSNLVHRMTDFNLILRCIDEILGTNGQARLVKQSAELAADVIDGDPIAAALLRILDTGATGMNGEIIAEQMAAGITAENLLQHLTNTTMFERRGQGWPTTARVLSSRLRTIQPTMLQAKKIRMEYRKTNGIRKWFIAPVPADPGWKQPQLPT